MQAPFSPKPVSPRPRGPRRCRSPAMCGWGTRSTSPERRPLQNSIAAATLSRMGEVESRRKARPGEGAPFAAEPAQPSVLRPGPSPLPLSRSGEGLAPVGLAEKPADEIAQPPPPLALEALGPQDRGQVVEGAVEVVV